jgi:gluconolactonase
MVRKTVIAVLLVIGIVTSAGASDPGLTALVESGEVEAIATGFILTQGPVWHPDGYLLFSDTRADIIYKWTPDAKFEKFRSPSGKSDGLTFDRQGRLLAAEHANRRVSLTEADGTIVTLADRYEGRRLNSPNDLVVKSDGSIYFTDPTYGLRDTLWDNPVGQELPFQGVYRLSPDGKTLTLLVDDFRQPNGLAFSPDEKALYVGDTSAMHVRAFDVQTDGTLANGRVFADFLPGHPYGMKVDASGNLYVAGGTMASTGGVWVFDSTGKHLGNISVPRFATNCAFGGPDDKTLFITTSQLKDGVWGLAPTNSVYRIGLKVPGIKVLDR